MNNSPQKINQRINQKGFTIVEVMVSALILAFIVVGLAELYIYTSRLALVSGNMSQAISEAQSKMDEIRNKSFSSIATSYPSGTTFVVNQTLAGVTKKIGEGVIYLDTTNADDYIIYICVSFKDKQGRIIGEDNSSAGSLNGVIDAGEDVNGNFKLDSPVTLISEVSNR